MKTNKAKLITIIALSCAGLITAASIPLSAYASYSSYRNGIIGNKSDSNASSGDSAGDSSNTENPEEELQLVSIEAKLKDGVGYFNNKKAKPVADDFIVTAHYTKGGTNVDEEIYDDQYDMEVPESFYLTGGTIKFTFNGKETSLDLTLTPVAIASINVISDPYRTYYKEGDVFDKTGIVISGLNNDKSEVSLTEDDIEGLDTPLTNGQTTAEIHLKSDSSIKGSISITVVSAASFNDGRLLSIEVARGKAHLNDGADISGTDISSLEILRKYESGNKYLSKADNLEVATTGYTGRSGDNKTITIRVKGTNIATDVPLYIENPCNFSDASALTGVTASTEETYLLNSQGKAVSSGNASVVRFALDPDNTTNQSISINVNSNSYIAGSLQLKVSNNDVTLADEKYVANELKLNELFELKVNGHAKFLNASAKTALTKDSNKDIASKTYTDVLIKDLNLVAGNNSIVLSAKKGAKASNVSVADFSFLSDGTTPTYGFLDYLEVTDNEKAEANYTCITTKPIQYKDAYKNTYCVIADDDYYYALQAKSWDGKSLVITKVNKTTLEIEKASEAIEYNDAAHYQKEFNIFFNEEGNVCYKDINANTASVYDKETLTKLETKISFSSINKLTRFKAAYNEENGTYATMIGGSDVKLFDKNGKELDCTFNTKGVKTNFPGENKFSAAGISAYGDYIIVNSRKDGEDTLHHVRVFDYDGNLLYTSNNETMATTGNDGKGHAVNYIFDDSGCYLAANIWNSGFNLFKVTVNPQFAKKFDTSTLGGYAEKAKYEGKTANYISTILNQDNGIAPTLKVGENSECFKNIDSTINVGGQIYASYSTGGSQYGVISKLDLENKKILANSDVITLGDDGNYWNKSNTLFSKDGYIGMVNNRSFTITFYDTETLKQVDKDVVSFSGLPIGTKVAYVTYNDLNKKFAIADSGNNLYFADEFGRVTSKVGTLNTPSKEEGDTNTKNFKTAQLTCDNGYVYMLYARDADYSACFNIYDWNGNFIKDEKFHLNDTIDASGTDKQINVQAMVNYNNKLYISVLQWGWAGQFLYEVTFDQTIFD